MDKITRRAMLGMVGAGGAALLARKAEAREDKRLKTRLTKEYGIEYPFVGAGMGFIALPPLVAAVTNGGGIGVLGNGAAPPSATQQMVQGIKSKTTGLYGVDLINDITAFGPAATDGHIDVCIAEGVPLVVFHWNPPSREWVRRLQTGGARVWAQVGSLAAARAAAQAGVDALVVQGTEAGGHVKSEAPLSALVPAVIDEVRPMIVVAAGGIGNGPTAAAALSLGAEGVWVGTRLIASMEAYAHLDYKRKVVEAHAADTTVTTLFGPEWPGQPMRVYRNRVVNEWAGREDEVPNPPPPPDVIGTSYFFGFPYPMPKFSSLLPTPDVTGDFEEMCLAMGTSCEHVHDIKPAAQIVVEMMEDAAAVLKG